MLLRSTIALLLALSLCGGTLAGPVADRDPGDQAFLMARDAFRDGNAARLARAASLLGHHVLAPYVEQWQLRLRLEEASPDEVRAFLERHDGTLVAEQLRAEWLKLLARRGEWEAFRAQRLQLVNDDADIRCYDLYDRAQRGDASVAVELRRLWLAPNELPAGCAALAEELLLAGRYGPDDVWQRFRVLADANRMTAARRLLQYLPTREIPATKVLDRVIASPARYLLQLTEGLRTRTGRELAMFALARIARNDPLAAADRFDEGLRDEFSLEEQGRVWGHIATVAARRHMPEALAWFVRAGDARLGDEQRAWHVRSALRARDWHQVIAAVERMTPQARVETPWVYWRARALKELGRDEEAAPLFARIAGGFDFYGLLAAEELGMPLALPPAPGPVTEAEHAAMAARPGIARALALFRLDMRTEAVREWNWTVRTMHDRDLLVAAEVARRLEIWDRAISTAERTVAEHDFSLRYPAPHRELFRAQAKARDLEEHWVLGLVRQESRFIPWARSSAGAMGLMQLMPATARWVARRLGLKNFSLAHVNNVETNATLGTYYLRKVLDDLDGQEVLAAAAYNAGPGRARRWLGNDPMEGAIYIESIPFGETRDYVKKVMTNALYYAAVLGGRPGSLKARLGVVGSRDAIAATDTP